MQDIEYKSISFTQNPLMNEIISLHFESIDKVYKLYIIDLAANQKEKKINSCSVLKHLITGN